MKRLASEQILEEILMPPLPKAPGTPPNTDTVSALKIAEYQDIYALPHHHIKRLTTLLRQARKEKYGTERHQSRYRNVVHLPTKEQILNIMANAPSGKVQLIFKIMAQRGLRPNEAVRLKSTDILAVQYAGLNETVPVIRVNNTKCDRIEYCTITKDLYEEIRAYIEHHRLRILTHEDYLFYSTCSSSKQAHLSTDYLRNAFRRICNKLGYIDSYGEAKNVYDSNKPRHLRSLRLYDLRHYAITRFYNATKDIKLTQLFARHENADITIETYVNKHECELVTAINEAFKEKTLFGV